MRMEGLPATCDWTASEVVRAYKRCGENFNVVKKAFKLSSPQLKKLLRRAGITVSGTVYRNPMEELGLNPGDFVNPGYGLW